MVGGGSKCFDIFGALTSFLGACMRLGVRLRLDLLILGGKRKASGGDNMTKDEIALNKLKLGEIIEDAAGKMWLVSFLYKKGHIGLTCLSGKRITGLGEFFRQAYLFDDIHTTIEPLGVYSTDWTAKTFSLKRGDFSFCPCRHRPWKTLPATQKKQTVTVELEVDLETGEVVAKNKGGE